MAPSFDCAVSSLLCAEDNNSVFYDDNNDHDDVYDSYFVVDEFKASGHLRNHRINHEDRVSDGGLGLPMQSEECFDLMVEKECQHLPNVDYLKRLRSGDLDLGARKEAIDWIGKVHSQFGFRPICSYLSVNFLDRFLSTYELPKGKAWMMQLLAVACLSIAVKMEETKVPLSLDLQVGDSRFVFEARTIQRMELLVLRTLNWRMHVITPFSFIDHFLNKINNGETPTSLMLQSIQLILSAIKGIDFLEFRPSEIAAAVAIATVGETKTVDAEQAVSLLAQHAQKDQVMKCIQLVSLIGGSLTSAPIQTMPCSPISVLDGTTCLSYKTDESIAASSANSSQIASPHAKRRKTE